MHTECGASWRERVVRHFTSMKPPWFLSFFLNSSCDRRTGVLVFGEPSAQYIHQTIQSLKMANIPHEILSGAETNLRFPQQMKLPANHICVLEEDGGILYAQKALHAMQVCYVTICSYVFPLAYERACTTEALEIKGTASSVCALRLLTTGVYGAPYTPRSVWNMHA